MRRRGTTLIEQMIVLAILGIVTYGTTFGIGYLDYFAIEEVQRERALQILEYEADVLSRGAKPDPEARRALLALVRGARLASKPAGDGFVELSVQWDSPHGSMRRSLLVARSGK